MYHQLISEQRSQIFALLQKKIGRKEIAAIVGISQSTLSREIKRNSTSSGKYIWTKAHDMAMQRRKRTVKNASAELCQVQNYICDPHNPLNLISVSSKCWQNREELSLKLQSLIPRIGDMARESFLLLKNL